MSSFLSIIIPTYNSDSVIENCLLSIINQTFTDVEIVIQDSVSSDNTLKLIEVVKGKYPDADIKTFVEKDKGVYDAMNKAMLKASGEWLLFLGSDDKLSSPTILEEIFNQKILGNYNVLYGNVNVVGDTTWAKNGDIYDGRFDLKKIINRNICHQCIFYKKSFTDEIGFYNTDYVLCADWDYNLRCWAKTKFLFIDKVVSYFQAGGETTKTNTDLNFEKDFVKNLLSYFKISVRNPLINNRNFRYYSQVQLLQKATFPARILAKFKNKIKAFIKK